MLCGNVERRGGKAMRARRKVLLLVENAPIPGDPRVWNEAVSLRDAGYQVCIIAPRSAAHHLREAYACIEGIHVYRFKLFEARNACLAYLLEYACALWSIFWLSLKVWRRHGFDVIHVANPPDLLFLLGLFYRCFAKKLVFDQHDLSPELFQVLAQGRARPLYWLLRALERCSYACAHMVIVTNGSFKDLALKRGGCSSEKVFIVRNGPHLKQIRSYKLTADPFFPHKKPYVLVYLGIMGRQDGVENALYALHDLVSLYGRRDVSAVFIGAGSALPGLRALTRKLELEEYVFFTGWLEMGEILSYLSIAHIGLVPDPQNGLNELCTLVKVLEYMALGLPLVAFDLAETRISAGDAALYARPNEVADFARQLDILLNSEALRHNLGALGRSRIIEALSWEHSSRELLAGYETLFASAKAVASEAVANSS
jgi:glycosyltransferase involved in cell wall biosynthesis